jgi:hypothetical protein
MSNTTLSQKINELKDQGYTLDFNIESDRISEHKDKTAYKPNEFKVDGISILYAITTSDGKKGVLVDGYGVSGGQISDELYQKLSR